MRERSRGGAARRALVGVLLIALSVAAFVVVGGERDGRRELLVVTRDIPAGQVLTTQDLRPVSVGAGVGVDVVAADTVDAVVGRVAVVPLVAGSLLPAGAVGDRSRVPPAGRAVVGAALKAGQYPPELARGDGVSVILTAASTSAADPTVSTPATGAPVRSVQGLVVTVQGDETSPAGDSGAVVSLQVADGDAEAVAEAAAAGRVALVVRAVPR
ncbi:SAF domain-containing protein [Frankia sp. Cpl3]|uniref:SAF domain-containing protein n=1 Tax=Parafrankia colletiae TaxID=573497 RepID=UPI001F52126F|nr:SAF domain-containing protein [Parafrankia colletiae]MCK9904197.1 SAF domain-containing protein [Frankia sp. Cpl3]